MKSVQETFDQVMEIVFMSVDEWRFYLNRWFTGPIGGARMIGRVPKVRPLAPLNPLYMAFAPEVPA